MNELSAPNIVVAPLEPAHRSFLSVAFDRLEHFLEAERTQLPLWFVAMLGAGVAAWFALPGPGAWAGLMCLGIAILLGGVLKPGSWTGRSLLGAGLALALGCGWIWLRSLMVAAPVLERPIITEMKATIVGVEPMVAKGDVRLTVRTEDSELPPLVRFSLPADGAPAGLAAGSVVKARVRLQPPPPMALPGTHDFARDAWFKGLGGVGRAIGPIELVTVQAPYGIHRVRTQLDEHIRQRLQGDSGGIATALATGGQHAVSEEDADAMRRSGLTHLLSVSGLHIAAVVGAAMLLALKLLALSERLALRFNLVLVAAGVGALAGVGYTMLTGMQVPTVRSCIAALLVLGGIALGRDALSLRLVAVGALAVILFRPEAVAGASFQLSFAAVTAIIAFHNLPQVKRWFGPSDGGVAARLLRGVGSLLVTGLVVELALMPLALYHFHKAGLYGVVANMIAIPWTTFVIMPTEALALLLDTVGLGAPMWAVTGWAIECLLALAHRVGDAKGAVASLPSVSIAAFALMIVGGLWLALWNGRVRVAGLIPVAIGATWAFMTPAPDMVVTGDGRHLAIVEDGRPLILRDRAGEFVQSLMSEAAGFDGDSIPLSSRSFANCNRDSCVAVVAREGRQWVVLAVKSSDRIRWEEIVAACAQSDIVVAPRRLPRACLPRWLKLDRAALDESGGVAIRLADQPAVVTVNGGLGDHPWVKPHLSMRKSANVRPDL